MCMWFGKGVTSASSGFTVLRSLICERAILLAGLWGGAMILRGREAVADAREGRSIPVICQ